MKYYKHQTRRIGRHAYYLEWKFNRKVDAQKKANSVRKKKHYARVVRLPEKKWGVYVGPYNAKKGKKRRKR